MSGFLINVFIVAVNISKWKKVRPMSTADKVITSLGISRMVFPVIGLLKVILYVYFCRLSFLFFVSVMFLEFTCMHSSIWLSTLLSVIFCLKISALQNAFCLQLKIFVLNRVSHLIMASVMVSVSYALMFSLLANVDISNNSTQETYNNVLMSLSISSLIFLTTGPFLINFVSSVLLIIYLYHHVSRMKSERNKTSQLDPYYKTIKFTGFSLFCSTVSIIFELTYKQSYAVLGLLGNVFLCQIPPTLHSIYLIYVTAKLRIQVSNMVRFLWRR
ncbi:taste receptor type 2 member 4-like [Eleutherodactylus coqui]|uniref:taste receptor type 2 member 4-like n=1 Tax=Eleutherodactylus coqui TaxID=57060 RepID=UPI003462D57A